MVNISFAPGLVPVLKHQSGKHDQKLHGSWSEGGNKLGIEEVMRLHKSSDPLKSKVYAAEQSLDKPSKNPLEKPTSPKRDDFQLKEDYENMSDSADDLKEGKLKEGLFKLLDKMEVLLKKHT